MSQRKRLEAEVRTVNAEARRRKGDKAEHFFVRNGVIDMIEPGCSVSDGGVPAAEIATLPPGFKVGSRLPDLTEGADLCGYIDETTHGPCSAQALWRAKLGAVSVDVCATHLESLKRKGPVEAKSLRWEKNDD